MIGRFVIVLAIGCSVSMMAEPPMTRVVIERRSEWTPPPPVGGVWHADGRVSILHSDGRFAVVNAILGTSRPGAYVNAILGEGYSVFSGCWISTGGTIKAVGYPVYIPGLINPSPAPITMTYRFDGRNFSHGRITPLGETKIETIKDTGALVNVAESRTKAFNSTSGSALWPCSKQ